MHDFAVSSGEAVLFQFSLLVAGAVLGILFIAVVLSFVLAYFGISV